MSIAAHAAGLFVMSGVLDDERPAGLARAAVAARAIVEAVAHLLCTQWFAAMVAHNRRIEIMTAVVVSEDQRRLAACEPVVAPTQHRDQRSVEILALFGQGIFVTLGLILIFAAHEDSFR